MSSDQHQHLEGGIEEGSKLYNKLLLDSVKDPYGQNIEPESKTVAPKPGFCLKTLDENEKKIFVNVCTSEGVLKPKDLSEDELNEIVETGDATKFRVPMAIGDAHQETDKNGKECTAYDIVINPSFFEKINKSDFFKEFFIMLIYEGLQNKHDLKLSNDYTILKNRKAIGTIGIQNVRTKSTPVIMEMDPDMYQLEKENLATQRNSEQIKEISTKISSGHTPKFTIPEYKIIKEPPEGDPEYLILEVKLPNMKSSKSLTLDVGEDCVILSSLAEKIKLDIDLPTNVDNDETGAQFNKRTKVLTVTMPCCR